MLSSTRRAFLNQTPENRIFCLKQEALTVSTLRRHGFVKKAERAVSPCNKAVIALRQRPYCKVKRPSRECREALTADKTAQKHV